MSLALSILLLILGVPLVVALLRINELFLVRVRGGKVRVVRGRIPQALLNDFAEILRDPPLEECSLRGVVEDRRLRIYPEGALNEGQRQRIRNVVAGWPVAKIRNAPRS